MQHSIKQKPAEETESLYRDPLLWALALWGALIPQLAFPPNHFWPLIFLAPAPAWAYSLCSPARKGFWGGWFYGFGYFTSLLWWLVPTMVDFGGLPLALACLCLFFLASYLALFPAAVSVSIATISQKNPSLALLTGPLAWTGLEFLRSIALGGFPWGDLPQALWRVAPALDLAPWIGIDGVRFLIAAVAVAPAWPLARFLGKLRVSPWILGLPGAAALVFACAPIFPTPVPPPEGEFVAALIQGNIDQSVKWDPWFRDSTMETYFKLTRRAVRENPEVDFALWPETSVPFYAQEPGDNLKKIQSLVKKLNIRLAFGAPAYNLDSAEHKPLNSVFLMDSNGEYLGRYDKVHLVPFGEFVPMGRLLPFISKLVEGSGDFIPGPDVFALKADKAFPTLGPLICFEAIFPELASKYPGKGAQVLTVVTNDGWFGDTPGPYQHLAFSAWRAAEMGMPLIRAANTGISAAFNARGRLLASTKIQTEAVEVTKISYPPAHRTPQNSLRIWISLACLLLAGTILFATLRGRPNIKNLHRRK